MPAPAKPLTLREIYQIYKEGGRNAAFGRQDMIGHLVDAVEALQGRIGAVDEAAVASLDHRVASLETVIGNALMRATPAVDHADCAVVAVSGHAKTPRKAKVKEAANAS